ncbi:MAG: lytic transglycosylase [Desulfuromonas sp.]|nr:MAG: lytic transglycosylase [Desulfuromonas sp.]
MSQLAKITLIFIFLSAAVGTSASAAIYRYVDANGQMHFTNTPTENKYTFYRNESHQVESTQGKLESLIVHFASKFNLDIALIKAVIKVESDFNPQVVSSKGAQGLMQLMPETAREIGVNDPFNPSESIYGGSYYLRKMLDSFDSNLDHALAAYNAGPTAVRRYGGIPPYKETQDYVEKVKYYLEYYRETKETF